jgi:membrane protease YdiL (CAAX protease family)
MSIPSPDAPDDAPAAALNPYASPEVLARPTPDELPAGRRPRVWTVFATIASTFAIVIVGQIIAVAGMVVWMLSNGGTVQTLETDLFELIGTPGGFIGLGILSQISIGGMAFVAGWLSPEPLQRRLGLLAPRCSTAEVLLLTAGSLVPFAVGMGFAYALAEVIPPDPTTEALYENMTPGWAIPFLVFIAFAPGFCEEVFFRGYCQRRLLERWHPATAILVSSLIFALFHVEPHTVLFAFPVGIWIGLMAWRSGSIWPGVLCHAAINGLWNVYNLGILFDYWPEEPAVWFLVLLGIAGLAAFFASIAILRRPLPATDNPATPALPGL